MWSAVTLPGGWCSVLIMPQLYKKSMDGRVGKSMVSYIKLLRKGRFDMLQVTVTMGNQPPLSSGLLGGRSRLCLARITAYAAGRQAVNSTSSHQAHALLQPTHPIIMHLTQSHTNTLFLYVTHPPRSHQRSYVSWTIRVPAAQGPHPWQSGGQCLVLCRARQVLLPWWLRARWWRLGRM